MPNGLVRKSSAPASSAAILSFSCSRTDTTMMGVCVHSRSRRVTSTPSMSGRPRSRMMISGRSAATAMSASSPVVASNTAYCPPNDAFKKRRMERSSSTTRIRTDCSLIAHSNLQRQCERNNSAAARAIGSPDTPLMRFDDPFADRQTKAGACDMLGSMDAIKLIKNTIQVSGWDTNTPIQHGDLHFASLDLSLNFKRRAIRRVLQSIIEQVDECMNDEDKVQRHQGHFRRELHTDLAIGETVFNLSQRGTDQVLHIGQLSSDAHRPRFQTGHIEQIADQAVQAVCFFISGLDQAAPRIILELMVLRGECAQRAGNRDQGRAQVMRDRIQQRILQLFGSPQQLNLARLISQFDSLDRQGRLTGKGLQQAALVSGELSAGFLGLDAQHAYRALRGCHRQVTRPRSGKLVGASARRL